MSQASVKLLRLLRSTMSLTQKSFGKTTRLVRFNMLKASYDLQPLCSKNLPRYPVEKVAKANESNNDNRGQTEANSKTNDS